MLDFIVTRCYTKTQIYFFCIRVPKEFAMYISRIFQIAELPFLLIGLFPRVIGFGACGMAANQSVSAD